MKLSSLVIAYIQDNSICTVSVNNSGSFYFAYPPLEEL